MAKEISKEPQYQIDFVTKSSPMKTESSLSPFGLPCPRLVCLVAVRTALSPFGLPHSYSHIRGLLYQIEVTAYLLRNEIPNVAAKAGRILMEAPIGQRSMDLLDEVARVAYEIKAGVERADAIPRTLKQIRAYMASGTADEMFIYAPKAAAEAIEEAVANNPKLLAEMNGKGFKVTVKEFAPDWTARIE